MFKSKKGFIYQRENLKTMILSKINYIISSIHLPETILVQRNRVLFRFLKNPKHEGILKKFKEKFFTGANFPFTMGRSFMFKPRRRLGNKSLSDIGTTRGQASFLRSSKTMTYKWS